MLSKIRFFITDENIEMFFKNTRKVYKDKNKLWQTLQVLEEMIRGYAIYSNNTAAVGKNVSDIIGALDMVEQVTKLKDNGELEKIDDKLENYLGIKVHGAYSLISIALFNKLDQSKEWQNVELVLPTINYSTKAIDSIFEYLKEYNINNIAIFGDERTYFLNEKDKHKVFDIIENLVAKGKKQEEKNKIEDLQDVESFNVKMVSYMNDYFHMFDYNYENSERYMIITILNEKIYIVLNDVEFDKNNFEKIRFFKLLEEKNGLADELKFIAENFKKIDVCCVNLECKKTYPIPLILDDEKLDGILTDDIIKHIVDTVEMEFFKVRDKEPLKAELKKVTDEVMNKDIKVIFNTIINFLDCYFPKFYNFKAQFIPNSDRDYLDLSIEMYSFIYCKLYDLDYKEAEKQLGLIEDPFLSSLLNYKMVKYGAEIFSNLGMEIVGKNKEGYIVRELEEIEKTKLN